MVAIAEVGGCDHEDGGETVLELIWSVRVLKGWNVYSAKDC